MDQPIYFDNAATTRATPAVAEVMRETLLYNYGNPSSPHRMGLQAEKIVEGTRQILAAALGCRPQEVYFTSGGTEANNLAIRGILAARRRQGRHVVTSAVEHAAVLDTLKQLARSGECEYTAVGVNGRGEVDPEAMVAAVRKDTVLVTLMLVNNEVGTIEPVAETARLLRERYPDVCIHTDAVQALGKVPCRVSDLGVDLLTVSGHKLQGPKGVGALFVRQGTRITTQITGGGQEAGLRSGTENVPGIAGMGRAVRDAMAARGEHWQHWRKMQKHLLELLVEEIPDCHINGQPLQGAPHIVNVGFAGIRGEVLVHFLEEKGLFVSTGSACSSRKQILSHVLPAMGVPEPVAEGSIRLSFGPENTLAEVERAVVMIKEAVTELRRFQRR